MRPCAARKNPVSAKDLDCSSVLLKKPVIRRAMLFVRSVLSATDLLSAMTMTCTMIIPAPVYIVRSRAAQDYTD